MMDIFHDDEWTPEEPGYPWLRLAAVLALIALVIWVVVG